MSGHGRLPNKGQIPIKFQRCAPSPVLSLRILEIDTYHRTRQNLSGEGVGEERAGRGGKRLAFSPKHLLSERNLIPATGCQLHSHTQPPRGIASADASQLANVSPPRSHK